MKNVYTKRTGQAVRPSAHQTALIAVAPARDHGALAFHTGANHFALGHIRGFNVQGHGTSVGTMGRGVVE